MNTVGSSFKRVKERSVNEAMNKVDQWKNLFNGQQEGADGQVHRISINQAAEMVGIPKKTLEDYTQLFSKVNLLTNIDQFQDKKMGYLRSYLRKNQGKLRKILRKLREEEFRKRLEEKSSKQTENQEENHLDAPLDIDISCLIDSQSNGTEVDDFETCNYFWQQQFNHPVLDI